MDESLNGTESGGLSASSEPVPDESSADAGVLDQIIETIPEPTLVLDGACNVVTGNDQFEALLGREVDALAGAPAETVFPALTRDQVTRNCTAPAGEYIRTPGESGDGKRMHVEIGFERLQRNETTHFIGTLRDVTTHRETEQVRDQYERILEAVEDGIYVLDESFTIERVNGAVTSMTGYEREELVGESATVLADETTIDQAIQLSQELIAGEREFGTLTTDLETADGRTFPAETRFSTYCPPNGEIKQVGIVRDISDRRQFEKTLTALHQSTHDLLRAQTNEQVSKTVVESMTDIDEVDGAATYWFDRSEGVLSLSSDRCHLPADLSGRKTIDDTDNPLWRSFIRDERVAVESGVDSRRENDETEGICFPLGSYGVLYVTFTVEELRDRLVEIMDVVAANAEAALARVSWENALRENEDELANRNRRLRQLEELNSLIRNIDQALVDTDTREGVEEAVCERLADSRWFSLVWIGRQDGETLEPRAWAGDGAGYLDSVPLTLDTADHASPPAVQTARDGTMTAIPSTTANFRREEWRAEALTRDFQSVLSVPLQYESCFYGVLTLYGTEQDVFDETLQSVCRELGKTIARAISDIQSRRQRSGASLTELELTVHAPTSPLWQLADCTGETLVCEGVVPSQDGMTRLFVHSDAGTAAVVDQCTELTRIDSVTAVGDTEGEETLYEIVVTGETVVGTLLEEGVRIETVRASHREAELTATVRLPSSAGVRGLVERLDSQFESARLTARRERNIPDRTRNGIHSAIEEQLTDRQLEMLRTAYFNGFFDWPRATNGQELAERFGVSQPTVSRHLRTSTQRVLDLVFGGASGTT